MAPLRISTLEDAANLLDDMAESPARGAFPGGQCYLWVGSGGAWIVYPRTSPEPQARVIKATVVRSYESPTYSIEEDRAK